MKILLDPGHAWNGNPYPPQKGFYEGTQMWKLSTFLMPELKKYGFDVTTTRPNLRDFMDVADRGKMAKGFNLVVSLHSNAPGSASDTKTTGTVIIYTLETPEIVPLADEMGKRISNLMGHHYRGSIIMESASRKGKNRNSVLRNAIAVGCKAGLLLEHGFHTNPKDSAFLVVDENLKKLATAEAEAIAKYYGAKGDEGNIMLNRTLRHGMEGEDVKLVQEFLKARGYYTGPIDGKFGPGQGFLNAVKAFQKDHGLTVDGIIGPATRARIIEMMINPEKIVEEKIVEITKEVKVVDTAKVNELQSEINTLKAMNEDYVQYFRLQNKLAKGV